MRHYSRLIFVIVASAVLALGLAVPTAADTLAPQDLYKKALPSVVSVYTDKVIGSGFLAVQPGVVVSAWHVFKGAKTAKVKFPNGDEVVVDGLIDVNKKKDICLVAIKDTRRPLLPLTVDAPDIGSRAYAIGAPIGLDFAFSDGLISRIDIHEKIIQYQFTAPVSHGNSGGPLLNDSGRVVGIVDSILTGAENVNFAVPALEVLHLDPEKPVVPWRELSGDSADDGAPSTPGEDLDRLIADGLESVHNGRVAYAYSSEFVLHTKKLARRIEIPDGLFEAQSALRLPYESLQAAKTKDTDRDTVRRMLRDEAECLYRALDYVSQASQELAMRDDDSPKKAMRLLNRGTDAWYKQPWLTDDALATLHESKAFADNAKDIVRSATFASSENFGALLDIDTPNKVVGVVRDSDAWNSGFRRDDIVHSVNGTNVATIAAMVELLQKAQTSPALVIVDRGSKNTTLKVTLERTKGWATTGGKSPLAPPVDGPEGHPQSGTGTDTK